MGAEEIREEVSVPRQGLEPGELGRPPHREDWIIETLRALRAMIQRRSTASRRKGVTMKKSWMLGLGAVLLIATAQNAHAGC